MKIQILISKNSWATNFEKQIKNNLKKFSKKIIFNNNHKKIRKNFDINIIFSYFKKIPKNYLNKSKFNLIPHESALPKGKGMSPLTWQVINGNKFIIFSLIEATSKIDSGEIYFQKKVQIDKTKIFKEIKDIQFKTNISLILKFLNYYKKFKKKPKSKSQNGKSTFYKTRRPSDSKININKSLVSQLNLLRACDFQNYPAFFVFKNTKFLLKLDKSK